MRRQSGKISALATLVVGIFLLTTMQIAFAQVVAWGSQGDQVGTVQKKLKQ